MQVSLSTCHVPVQLVLMQVVCCQPCLQTVARCLLVSASDNQSWAGFIRVNQHAGVKDVK